jgi:hypothetical protein
MEQQAGEHEGSEAAAVTGAAVAGAEDQTDAPRRALLVRYLASHDQPCPNCRYNLRGLTAARCPECNLALQLRVSLVHPGLVLWLTGLIGLSLGTGLAVMMNVFMVLRTMQQSQLPPHAMNQWVYAVALPAAVLGLMLASYIRGRVRFRAMNVYTRRGVVTGCWLASIVYLAWFTMIIN